MKKKSYNVGGLIVGILLVVISIVLCLTVPDKKVGGICIGLGSGLIGLSCSNLFMLRWYKNHPEELKKARIEATDERNELIRSKAKAKCADILQWFILGVAWVAIFAGLPIWMTMLLIGIYLLKFILDLWLMTKFNKEM